jgi:hypothetical protein
MIQAVDVQYGRSLQYHSRLFARINAAHKNLQDMQKYRDELQAELAAKERNVMGNHEAIAFKHYLATYRDTVASKDAEIDSMNREIGRYRQAIVDMQTAIDRMRGRVNDHRNISSGYRGINLSSRTAARNETMFMTEPPDTVPLGGGFIQTFNRDIPSGLQNLDLQLAPSTPHTAKRRPNEQAKGAKRILRPQSTGRRRAQTALAQIRL